MPGPWFWNCLVSVIFTSINVALFIRTDFASLVFYDVSIVGFMLLSVAVMLIFLWQMRTLPHLEDPLVIPHPTFICSLVLTISVTIGYCYIFIYKMALYGCDRAVEATDPEHMALDSALRLSIAIFSLVSFVYIMQRAHVGSLETPFDVFVRNFINSVFGIVWLRFILLKAYFTIEQFCRDQLEVNSVIKSFCPPYVKNGFNCSTTDMRKEQQIWYRVHYGLLKSVVVTCASEFVPVLLVAHWIACGRAEVIVRKLTVKMNEKAVKKSSIIKRFSTTITDAAQEAAKAYYQSALYDDRRQLISSRSVRLLLKVLAISLVFAGFCLWFLSFYNYINDLEDGPVIFVQDTVETCTSILQLAFFVLLFMWVRQIPEKWLSLHRMAESRGDRVLIFGSVLFLSFECVCEILELLFFGVHKKSRVIIKLMDMVYSVFTLVANWLEALCLQKVIALKDQQLRELRNILPFVSIGCIAFNMADFAMTYFYIETEKHHMKEVIESLDSSEIFVLIGVVGRILDTANYLYTFTCALCWLDVILRFGSNLFVVGKKGDEDEEEWDEEQSEQTTKI